MPVKIAWRGTALVERTIAATAVAQRETVRRAAARARTDHPWASETGHEESGIWAGEPHVHGDTVRTFWGAPGPAYFLEVGTVHMPAFPFLRPAGDVEYHALVGLIRASLL